MSGTDRAAAVVVVVCGHQEEGIDEASNLDTHTIDT